MIALAVWSTLLGLVALAAFWLAGEPARDRRDVSTGLTSSAVAVAVAQFYEQADAPVAAALRAAGWETG